MGPNDPFSVEVNPYFLEQPSQRLFWGNGAGTNQVGGTGLWATLTNKFPILGTMFGRMELPSQYGAPTQYNGVSTQYSGVPSQYYGPPSYQFYQAPPQQYNPYPQQYFRQFQPARDFGLTDDAVIITPPQVPINPQPAFPSAPSPAPEPLPNPQPEPQPGYQYSKPQYSLELPRK